jgi:hypothetical protein
MHRLRHGAPVSRPHHTLLDVGLLGGGQAPMPGDVSLAHHSVRFRDERPECRRRVLEALRQPLEKSFTYIPLASGVELARWPRGGRRPPLDQHRTSSRKTHLADVPLHRLIVAPVHPANGDVLRVSASRCPAWVLLGSGRIRCTCTQMAETSPGVTRGNVRGCTAASRSMLCRPGMVAQL